ncbi:hypothetical protein CCACVL1_21666 [Corchorus capsularis]|uniref:Uncharacterized protein n=1 Tax=Corchorus capsularis TaxID=210143 RepID=A0A1R3H2I1_COCAP|nr:hypothetical protein CCACVL1_21666 [Corchorus capsularis]
MAGTSNHFYFADDCDVAYQLSTSPGVNFCGSPALLAIAF